MARSVLIHDTIKIKYVNEGYITKNYPPHLLSDKEMMNGFLTDHLDEIINDPDITERYRVDKAITTENEDEVIMTDNDEMITESEIDIYPDPEWMEDRFTGYYMDRYVEPMFKQFSTLDIDDMTDDEYQVFLCMWDIAEYIIGLFEQYDEGIKNGTLEKTIEKIFPDWVYSYMLGAVIGQQSSIEDKHDLLTLLDNDNLYDVFTIQDAVHCYKISKKWIKKYEDSNRPPTCFGEPHVIKSLRLDNII